MPDRCDTCKAPVLFVRNVKTGKSLIVDAEPVADGELRPHRIVVSRSRSNGRVLTQADVDYITAQPDWRERFVRRGSTIHDTHWATCPDREEHRRRVASR